MESTAQFLLLSTNLLKAYFKADLEGVAVGWIALGMFGAEQARERLVEEPLRLLDSARLALMTEAEQRMFRYLVVHPVSMGSE